VHLTLVQFSEYIKVYLNYYILYREIEEEDVVGDPAVLFLDILFCEKVSLAIELFFNIKNPSVCTSKSCGLHQKNLL